MDLESLETQTLLKKRTPMRQSLALKLAVLLCGLGLFVGVAVPSTNQGLQGAATLKETQKVTATAGVSSTSRPASTMDPGGISGRPVDSPVELPRGHRQDRRRG